MAMAMAIAISMAVAMAMAATAMAMAMATGGGLNKFGKLAKGTPTALHVFSSHQKSLRMHAKTAVVSCNRQACAEKAARKSTRDS